MTEYEQLHAAIESRIASDPQLRALRKKISQGTATLAESSKYTQLCAQIMGQKLSGQVLGLSDREGVCTQLLRDRYSDVNQVCEQVMRSVDERAGIAMNPRHAAFPAERVQQLVHSLTDPTVSDETIQRRANTGAANVAISFHDDFVDENAAFRSDAGYECYITRVVGGASCPWCSTMAGRFRYDWEEMPEDIFRRHDNCTCTVTFEQGAFRQDVWSKHSWQAPETGAGAPPPKVFSKEEADRLEQERLSEYRGLIHEQNYTISPKDKVNAFSVNRKLVNSKEYHDKFEGLTQHKAANENIYQQSKRLLEHRDGKESESLIVVDSKTGISITDNFKNSDEQFKTGLTAEQYGLVQNHNGNFIMLHNHPESVRPSGTDILTLWKEKKADSSIILGHDGTVYVLSDMNRDIPLDKIYEDEYNKCIDMNFPKEFAIIKATDKLYETGAFSFQER